MSASLSISSKFIKDRERGRREKRRGGGWEALREIISPASPTRVVGGRLAGVEFSAEIHDFVVEDKAKLYPSVKDDVSLTIMEASSYILDMRKQDIGLCILAAATGTITPFVQLQLEQSLF